MISYKTFLKPSYKVHGFISSIPKPTSLKSIFMSSHPVLGLPSGFPYQNCVYIPCLSHPGHTSRTSPASGLHNPNTDQWPIRMTSFLQGFDSLAPFDPIFMWTDFPFWCIVLYYMEFILLSFLSCLLYVCWFSFPVSTLIHLVLALHLVSFLYEGCSISKVPQVMKIKWEVSTTMKVAHLFHWSIAIFQRNHQAHRCINPILARV